MQALQAGGVEQTALHNHVLMEERWPTWAATYHHRVKRRRRHRVPHGASAAEPAGVGA